MSFLDDFGRILAYVSCFCGGGATLGCSNPLLCPNTCTMGHLLKSECLVVDVTPVRSPARADRDIFGVFLSFLAKSGHFCGGGATL